MLVQNTPVTIEWVTLKNPLFANYNEAYFDLQITAPNGAVTYFEGVDGWANSFIPLTETTDGLISFNYTFTEPGVYVLILGTGTSDSFDIVNTTLHLVVEQDSIINNKVNLP